MLRAAMRAFLELSARVIAEGVKIARPAEYNSDAL
jgi:hypothetical protein